MHYKNKCPPQNYTKYFIDFHKLLLYQIQ